MNIFEMIVIIVTVSIIAGVLNNLAKRRRGLPDRDLEALSHRLQRLDDLEERVRVLESVITDSRFELDRQIQDLER